MEYAKLENGSLVYPKSGEMQNELGCTIGDFIPSQYLKYGFKQLVRAVIIPPLTWFQQSLMTYSETDTTITETCEVVATGNLKEVVWQHYNEICNNKILNGFTWRGASITLTSENQQNITGFYAIATTNPQLLGFPLTINFGGAVIFDNVSDVVDLGASYLNHLHGVCLSECWESKFAFMEPYPSDSQLYELLKTRYIPKT